MFGDALFVLFIFHLKRIFDPSKEEGKSTMSYHALTYIKKANISFGNHKERMDLVLTCNAKGRTKKKKIINDAKDNTKCCFAPL